MALNNAWLDGQGRSILLLAHGAGAPADSPYMDTLARAIASHHVQVVRFEFGYMERRRLDGRKRPPGSITGLCNEFLAKLDQWASEVEPQRPVFVGGKSMGGRIASLLVAESSMAGRVAGVIGFGYPFHPPGKPNRWRTEHFERLQCPLCILQGTRDPFGKVDEVARHTFDRGRVELNWLECGDHDLRPLKRQPESQSELIGRAAQHAVAFMARCAS